VLHNYSCPVARVMACIDAAAVVRREWSGADRTLPLSLSLSLSLSLPVSPFLSFPAARLDRWSDDEESLGPGYPGLTRLETSLPPSARYYLVASGRAGDERELRALDEPWTRDRRDR